MTILSELWEKAILNYWNKWKDKPAWKEEDIPQLYFDFIEEDGYYDERTGRIQIQSFVLSDPNSWSPEEKYLINKIPDKTKVLELGCGTGRFGVYLKENKQCDYTGIDVSPVMANICKERGLNAFVMDAKNITFPKGSFDVILATSNFFADILTSVSEIPNYLKKIKPLLTENGIMVVSSYYYTPNYKDYKYVEAHKEKFNAKAKWMNEETELFSAFRLQYATEIIEAIKKIGLTLLDQVEVAACNYEIVKWGFIMGKSLMFPRQKTLYVDWIPVRVTYTLPVAPRIVGDGLTFALITPTT